LRLQSGGGCGEGVWGPYSVDGLGHMVGVSVSAVHNGPVLGPVEWTVCACMSGLCACVPVCVAGAA
jgi:hypothetical protein